MPREAPLPPQWACLEGRVRYVQRHSAVEYSSSCPQCGGDVHKDKSWPDRFRLFIDGKPRAWCRQCGLRAFPDQFGADSVWDKDAEKYRQPPVKQPPYRADEQLSIETKVVLRAIMDEPPSLGENDPPPEVWARVLDNLTRAGYFGPQRA
jgi:hypothetical protein